MPSSKTIRLAFVIAHYSREYATAIEAAEFWRTADALLRAYGLQRIEIATQYGTTAVSRSAKRGLLLWHKGLHRGATMALIGQELRFDALLHKGIAMDVVRLALEQAEPNRMMGELRLARAA